VARDPADLTFRKRDVQHPGAQPVDVCLSFLGGGGMLEVNTAFQLVNPV